MSHWSSATPGGCCGLCAFLEDVCLVLITLLPPTAIMQEDLLNKWFSEADLEQPPLERPSKRRRLDCPGTGVEKQPVAPFLPRRAHSVDRPAIPNPASTSPCKPFKEGYWHDLDLPAARLLWLNRFSGPALVQGEEGSGLYWGDTNATLRIRRRASESCLLDTRRFIHSQSPKMADTSMPPPSPVATSLYRSSTSRNRGRTPSRSGRSDASGATQPSRIDSTNSNYRAQVLRKNGVYIINASVPLSTELAAEAERTRGRRSSPELSDRVAAEICEQILMRGDDAESAMEGLLPENGILPRDRRDDPRSHEHLRYVRRMPYSKAFPFPKPIIPDDILADIKTNIQSITIPCPDIAYGYTVEGFSSNQQLAQGSAIRGVDLNTVSMPAKDLFWPFFVVEFKALSTGGNIYYATNQCAGGGAVSVKAMEVLYDLASQVSDDFSDPLGTVAYSAAIDGELAIMYIHWFEDGKHCMERMDIYLLSRPAELIAFHRQVRNIVDWACSTRLDKIKSALDVVLTGGPKGVKRPLSPPVS